MKIACAHAIAHLARKEASYEVIAAYGGEAPLFGPEYIIPKPFDPRLIVELAPVVAQAAMDSGVAMRPIKDMDAYRYQLQDFVYSSSMIMRPMMQKAKESPKRITFAEGEEEKILRAAQIVVDEGIAYPILIGRPEVIDVRIRRMGLRLKNGENMEIINPHSDARYRTYWNAYHALLERRGITPDVAKLHVRTNTTIIGALTVHLGDSDGLVCGGVGQFLQHFTDARRILGVAPGVKRVAALGCVLLNDGPLFICDPYVNENPSKDELVDMAWLAADEVKRFGLIPRIAFISHSNYGAGYGESVKKMRDARMDLKDRAPDLMVDGEMHAELALNEVLRQKIFPNSPLQGRANILIMPSIEAANIALSLMKATTNGTPIGPMLMGMRHPAHVLTATSTVRSIVNMAARAVVAASSGE
jgi:malate dehydrogenase (oxaloacetate-decarboxylating)(NADP+)